jgi:hypothetical protein
MSRASVGTWRVSLVFLLILLSGVGCSKRSRFPNRFNVDPISEIPKGVTKEQYLLNFPLLDELGREIPVNPTGDPGHFPFGVIVMISVEAGMGFCSVSHTLKGYAVANAHCVENIKQNFKRVPIQDHYFVFYDKQGKKRFARASDYGFVGSHERLDIAVFKLSDEVANIWASADAGIAATSVDKNGDSTIEKVPPALFQIKMWVFDPFWRRDTRFGRRGMQFAPKTCTASRTKFQFMGHWMENGQVKSADLKILGPGGKDPNDSSVHFFFNECRSPRDVGDERSPIVKGNSGGLATRADNFREMIGVVHWKWSSEEIDPKHTYMGFSMRGNEAYEIPARLVREERKPIHLFGAGTTFDSVLRLIPDLFGIPSPTPVKPTT